MAPARKVTPEEKLLHIIEKPEEADKLDLDKKSKAGRLLFPFKKIAFKKITLRGINKLLVLASVVITVVFVFFFIKDERSLQARFESLKEEIKTKVTRISKEEKKAADVTTYLADTAKNNPFQVLPDVKKAETAEEKIKTSFKLVGIIWSDRPQAIIEDEATNKNYLVYEGDAIDKFTVSKIAQDEVKLIAEDGETILK